MNQSTVLAHDHQRDTVVVRLTILSGSFVSSLAGLWHGKLRPARGLQLKLLEISILIQSEVCLRLCLKTEQ